MSIDARHNGSLEVVTISAPDNRTRRLSLVVAVREGGDSFARAIKSLVALTGALGDEGSDLQVAVTIVDASGDPAVAGLLSGVRSFKILTSTASSLRDCWIEALDECDTEMAWLADSVAGIDPADAAALCRAAIARWFDESVRMWIREPWTSSTCIIRRSGAASVLGRISKGPSTSSAARLIEAVRQQQLGSIEALVAEPARTPAHWPGFGEARIHVQHADSLHVGLGSYAGPGTLIKSWEPGARIVIGSYTSIATDVSIFHSGANRNWKDRNGNPIQRLQRGAHRAQTATTYPIGILVPDAPFDEVRPPDEESCDPLIIGNDVWLGAGATIHGPVTIGDGAIICVGAVVLKDVPPYSVVAGNVGAVVSKRFSTDIVEALQRIRWWDWPLEEIQENWWWFTQPINAFVERFDVRR